MQTNCGIYQIVHKKTGKRYIGSSRNLPKRKTAHFRKKFWKFFEISRTKKGCGKYKYIPINEVHWGIIEYFPNDFPTADLFRIEHEWIHLIPAKMLYNYRGKRNH